MMRHAATPATTRMRTNSTRLPISNEYNTHAGSIRVHRVDSATNTFLLGIYKSDSKKVEPEIIEAKCVETVDRIV